MTLRSVRGGEMLGADTRGLIATTLVLAACGGRVDEDSMRPRGASGASGGRAAARWPVTCDDAPSAAPAWSRESCELRQVAVPNDHRYVASLVADSDGLVVLLGEPATGDLQADARLYRYSFAGEPEAEIDSEIRAGAALVTLGEGFAIIDLDRSRYLRLRRFRRDGTELENRLLQTPNPFAYIPTYNALWSGDRLHLAYLLPRAGDDYANAGYVHYARFDATGTADFDVRLTDPSGFVTPGDIQPWCGGTAVTSYRTRDDGISEVYLSYIDDSGVIAGELTVDGDAPQRMNSQRTSFLDEASDGTLLLTWPDSSLTRKDFTPTNALSIASIGYDGALREQQRFDLGRFGDVAGVHFAGELRVGLSRLEDESSAALRMTPGAERIDEQTLGERITELRGFVRTPAGFASLSERLTPSGASGSTLTVATCPLEP